MPYFFCFNDTATTEIYTLSLHDALPISTDDGVDDLEDDEGHDERQHVGRDRKSTRLNSRHVKISYAVICLKKKKKPEVAERKTQQNRNPPDDGLRQTKA